MESLLSTRVFPLPENRAAEKEEGFVDNLGRSFAYTLVQSPLNGATQLSDKTAGTNWLPKVQFIDPPKEAEFGSKNWHAQQIGAAAGLVPWIVAMNKGIGALSTRSVLKAESVGLARTALAAEMPLTRSLVAREAAISGLSGALYGGLLTPVAHNETNFVGARLRNAAVTGTTFAVLTGSTGEMQRLGWVKGPALSGVLSGIPAGATHAQLNSLLSGKGMASLKETGSSMYTFAMVGGVLGVTHGHGGKAERTGERAPTVENVFKDCLKVESMPNGAQRGMTTEGTRIIRYDTNIVQRVTKSGEQRIEGPDGTRISLNEHGGATEFIAGKNMKPDADGTLKLELPDSIRLTKDSAGNVVVDFGFKVTRTNRADGSVTETYRDGTVVRTTRDGLCVTEAKDYRHTRQIDGTEITEHKDGMVVTVKPDRTTIIETSDGVQITTLPDGTDIIIADGVRTIRHTDGRVEGAPNKK